MRSARLVVLMLWVELLLLLGLGLLAGGCIRELTLELRPVHYHADEAQPAKQHHTDPIAGATDQVAPQDGQTVTTQPADGAPASEAGPEPRGLTDEQERALERLWQEAGDE